MRNDVQHWLEYKGIEYLRELGVSQGQVVVDFGCNAGHYTIPAAEIVSTQGKVFAMDNDTSAIERLKMTAANRGLKNIEIVVPQKATIELSSHSADIILIYDVLHYLNNHERKSLYRSAHFALKNSGLLSIFPKHYKNDWPMWHLADLDIADIIKEIERAGFILKESVEKRLLHDETIENGHVLNFTKSAKSI